MKKKTANGNLLFRLSIRIRDGIMHVKVYENGYANNGGVKYTAFVWQRVKRIGLPTHDRIIFQICLNHFLR